MKDIWLDEEEDVDPDELFQGQEVGPGGDNGFSGDEGEDDDNYFDAQEVNMDQERERLRQFMRLQMRFGPNNPAAAAGDSLINPSNGISGGHHQTGDEDQFEDADWILKKMFQKKNVVVLLVWLQDILIVFWRICHETYNGCPTWGILSFILKWSWLTDNFCIKFVINVSFSMHSAGLSVSTEFFL